MCKRYQLFPNVLGVSVCVYGGSDTGFSSLVWLNDQVNKVVYENTIFRRQWTENRYVHRGPHEMLQFRNSLLTSFVFCTLKWSDVFRILPENGKATELFYFSSSRKTFPFFCSFYILLVHGTYFYLLRYVSAFLSVDIIHIKL